MLVDGKARVSVALRLGWHLAELRGRLKTLGPPGEKREGPYALQLMDEWTKAEMAIGVEAVVKETALDLMDDMPLNKLTTYGAAAGTVVERLHELSDKLLTSERETD